MSVVGSEDEFAFHTDIPVGFNLHGPNVTVTRQIWISNLILSYSSYIPFLLFLSLSLSFPSYLLIVAEYSGTVRPIDGLTQW